MVQNVVTNPSLRAEQSEAWQSDCLLILTTMRLLHYVRNDEIASGFALAMTKGSIIADQVFVIASRTK
jgi:hypothetical protein